MLKIISQKAHRILSMIDKKSYILIKEIEISIELLIDVDYFFLEYLFALDMYRRLLK